MLKNVQYLIANTKKGETSRSPQSQPTNTYEELLTDFLFLKDNCIELLDCINRVESIGHNSNADTLQKDKHPCRISQSRE